MRIREVLAGKSRHDVVTISPDAGVRELLAVLADAGIGAVVVSSDGVHLDGIVSERDVVRHLHHDGTVVNNVVSAIMTPRVHTCTPDTRLEELMATMTDLRVRHMPVMEGHTVIGVVSIGDVVKARMGELEFERDQLDSYVHQS